MNRRVFLKSVSYAFIAIGSVAASGMARGENVELSESSSSSQYDISPSGDFVAETRSDHLSLYLTSTGKKVAEAAVFFGSPGTRIMSGAKSVEFAPGNDNYIAVDDSLGGVQIWEFNDLSMELRLVSVLQLPWLFVPPEVLRPEGGFPIEPTWCLHCEGVQPVGMTWGNDYESLLVGYMDGTLVAYDAFDGTSTKVCRGDFAGEAMSLSRMFGKLSPYVASHLFRGSVLHNPLDKVKIQVRPRHAMDSQIPVGLCRKDGDAISINDSGVVAWSIQDGTLLWQLNGNVALPDYDKSELGVFRQTAEGLMYHRVSLKTGEAVCDPVAMPSTVTQPDAWRSVCINGTVVTTTVSKPHGRLGIIDSTGRVNEIDHEFTARSDDITVRAIRWLPSEKLGIVLSVRDCPSQYFVTDWTPPPLK